jgi:hypothetical protein
VGTGFASERALDISISALSARQIGTHFARKRAASSEEVGIDFGQDE